MITLEIHITARWLLAFRDAATPSIRLIAICFLQSFSLPVGGLGRWRNRQDSVGGKISRCFCPCVLLPEENHHDQRQDTENRSEPRTRPVNAYCRGFRIERISRR